MGHVAQLCRNTVLPIFLNMFQMEMVLGIHPGCGCHGEALEIRTMLGSIIDQQGTNDWILESIMGIPIEEKPQTLILYLVGEVGEGTCIVTLRSKLQKEAHKV